MFVITHLVCRCKTSRGAVQARQSPMASRMREDAALILIRRSVALALVLVLVLSSLTVSMERLP